MALQINYSVNSFNNAFLRTIADKMADLKSNGMFDKDSRVVLNHGGFLTDRNVSPIKRDDVQRSQNDAIRKAFCEGIEAELSPYALSTDALGAVFKAADYGKGKPLTERRIVSVLNALSELKAKITDHAANVEVLTLENLTSPASPDRLRKPEFATEVSELAHDIVNEGYFENIAEALANREPDDEIIHCFSQITNRIVMGARGISSKFDNDELTKIFTAITRAAYDASPDLAMIVKDFGKKRLNALSVKLADISQNGCENFVTDNIPALKLNAFKGREIIEDDVPESMRLDLGADYGNYSPEEIVDMITEEVGQNDLLVIRMLPNVIGALHELAF